MHTLIKYVTLIGLAGCLFCGGCGGAGRAPLAKVKGTVTYRGEPVKSGTIVFEVPGARPATGKIVDGQIVEVTTHDPNDGVPIGQAKIAVFATQAGPSAAAGAAGSDPGSYKPGTNYMDAGAKPAIPAKYNNPATSGLSKEIKRGENTLELNLTD
jgi:hypothetical protein